MTEPADRSLVDAVVGSGDDRAFELLYRRHTPAMYALALRLAAGSEPDAEDVVHDAWIRAVERFPGFEWRSALRSWLCGFVVMRWREMRRRADREPTASGSDEPAAVIDLELTSTVDRLDLERAVSGLADGHREVLVLHDIEGFTHEEIAHMLGIETGTSKSRLSRARGALRDALGEAREELRNERP